MALFPFLLTLARSFFAPRVELVAEILALRQQLAILNRTANQQPSNSNYRLTKRNGFLTDQSKGCSGRQLRQCIACHPTRRSWEKLSFVRWSGRTTGFCPYVDPRP